MRLSILALASGIVAAVAVARAEPPTPAETIAIPGGRAGIGFDDLQYAPALKRILVPAGRTGTLALIDPASRNVTTIAGFSGEASYRGGHGQGTTSAAELTGFPGFVVATDRGAAALRLVDTRSGKLVQSVTLAASPDYVRFVGPTGEVWVSEPARKQVQVLRLEGKERPRLAPAAIVPVPDGPESLVIDPVRGRAYSHTWKAQSYAIDLKTRALVATWSNGCRGSRGMALDAARGLLFAGCAEGKVTVVRLATREVVATAVTGPDVDSIGYAATVGRLYVPAGGSAELWVFAVAPEGTLGLLGKLPTAPDAHTIAFPPDARLLFVGAPDHGAVLLLRDPF